MIRGWGYSGFAWFMGQKINVGKLLWGRMRTCPVLPGNVWIGKKSKAVSRWRCSSLRYLALLALAGTIGAGFYTSAQKTSAQPASSPGVRVRSTDIRKAAEVSFFQHATRHADEYH